MAITLDDKYVAEAGSVYLTGTQALVRLPMSRRLHLGLSRLAPGYLRPAVGQGEEVP